MVHGRISSDISPLQCWAQDPNIPPGVVHIRVFDKPRMEKNRMHEANRLLREVHRNPRAIRFRVPENGLHDLLQQASGKLDGEARQFGLDLIGTSDLKYGHTADLGVNEVHRKKGVLQPLPCTAREVDGDWWKTLGTCNVASEFCLHVPN